MVILKITNKEPNFGKTCDLLYSLASKRINDKYRQWAENEQKEGRYADYVDFYPSGRNLISWILNNKRTDDNPYLITPKILPVLLKELSFNDENEIFWGANVEEYLEDLITCLLLDMRYQQKYTKHWSDFNLNSEPKIRNFYQDYLITKPDNFVKLTDDFINFTYNTYCDFRLFETSGVFEIVNQDKQVNKKNKTEFLTFTFLPEKVKFLAEKIVIPLMSSINLENLLEQNIKSEEYEN